MKRPNRRMIITVLFVILIAGTGLFSLTMCKRAKPGVQVRISPEEFRTVPDSSRIWVYYWWLKGNVTRESITKDLEEMKKKGIGGFLLFDSRGYHDDYSNGIIPVPLNEKMGFMSAEWREMVKYTMVEAERLGLKMSINLANTGGSLRGPWNFGPDGPKKLIWSTGTVKGPKYISIDIKNPTDKNHFQDVALIAIRTKSNKGPLNFKTQLDLNSKWNELTVPKEDAEIAVQYIYLETEVRDGKLNWNVPEGDFRMVRFATTVIADEGSVDILNKEIVTKYFNMMGAELLNDAGPLAGQTLKYFYNVSWEGGEPNWTNGFEKDFEKFRGYIFWKYMPVLAGMIVGDHKESLRFMNDYYKTISNCFTENCYKTIGKLCHDRGVQWHSENGGPWERNAPMFRQADMLTFWGANDVPQGEFWAASPKDIENKTNSRFTAMASHIYGQPVSAIEAFTHMTTHWSKYPEFLKPFADMNYIDGSNMFIWHTFTASPPEMGLPGYEYFAGTHINPRVTWWEMSGDFITYLGRSQYMLQKGNFVADICCYVSDKNYIRWGRGKKWNEKSNLQPGPGYTFDLLNTEILVDSMTVKDGMLILPGGMKYEILVVDLEDQTIPEKALKKIIMLAKSGATVVLGQNKPVRSPDLENYPDCDTEILKMADELWGKAIVPTPKQPMGMGVVYNATPMATVMKDKNILPDFEGPFEYNHRHADNFDIYFICGTGRAECIFRVKEQVPEIWDPVTGKVMDAASYRFTEDGRMIIPLDLPVNGSVFIVFSRKKEKNYFTTINGPESGIQFAERIKDKLNIIAWKSGDYKFLTSRKKTLELKAEVSAPIMLEGPWELSFTPGWGAPERIAFDKLVKWNEHPDAGIKYFSGTGRYQAKFTLTNEQAGDAVRLQLGKVYNIARVIINGKNLGIIWTSPWVVDITDAIKEGENVVEVEVANCWANRLIGDCSLPENKRVTKTNVRLLKDRGTYRDYQAFSANDTLLSSGLVGPVSIEFGKKQELGY